MQHNNNSSSLISSIHKSRNVLLDLMKVQGYDVVENEGFSVNEINSMNTNKQLDMILAKRTKGEDEGEGDCDTDDIAGPKMYIHYYLAKPIRPQNIQELIDDLFVVEGALTTRDTLFIVTKDDANDTMVSLLKHIWEQDGIFIIIQNIKRLQFNILENALVPPHRIMSAEEVEQVKKKYNIMNNSQFPEISRFDPVAQAIGMRPNQVCEILRPSKTAIVSKYYRICT